MDLVILHILEEFREGPGAFVGKFLSQMTSWGSGTLILLCLGIIYWSISKKLGTYLLVGFNWNRLVNGFVKVMVCAYRPFVRDLTLIPDKAAIKGATGYSFPSGHSMNAASIFGGLAIYKAFGRPFRITCIVAMLLVGFSRLYLCVHTPQDVICGLIFACLGMYAAYRLLPIIDSHKNWDIYTAALSIAAAICVALYASLKSYPVDYDAHGKILVDSAAMVHDTFVDVGRCIGFFLGWVIERRVVQFSSENTMSCRLFHALCGTLVFYFFTQAILPPIQHGIGGNMGVIVAYALQAFYIVLLYPMVIKKFQTK